MSRGCFLSGSLVSLFNHLICCLTRKKPISRAFHKVATFALVSFVATTPSLDMDCEKKKDHPHSSKTDFVMALERQLDITWVTEADMVPKTIDKDLKSLCTGSPYDSGKRWEYF